MVHFPAPSSMTANPLPAQPKKPATAPAGQFYSPMSLAPPAQGMFGGPTINAAFGGSSPGLGGGGAGPGMGLAPPGGGQFGNSHTGFQLGGSGGPNQNQGSGFHSWDLMPGQGGSMLGPGGDYGREFRHGQRNSGMGGGTAQPYMPGTGGGMGTSPGTGTGSSQYGGQFGTGVGGGSIGGSGGAPGFTNGINGGGIGPHSAPFGATAGDGAPAAPSLGMGGSPVTPLPSMGAGGIAGSQGGGGAALPTAPAATGSQGIPGATGAGSSPVNTPQTPKMQAPQNTSHYGTHFDYRGGNYRINDEGVRQVLGSNGWKDSFGGTQGTFVDDYMEGAKQMAAHQQGSRLAQQTPPAYQGKSKLSQSEVGPAVTGPIEYTPEQLGVFKHGSSANTPERQAWLNRSQPSLSGLGSGVSGSGPSPAVMLKGSDGKMRDASKYDVYGGSVPLNGPGGNSPAYGSQEWWKQQDQSMIPQAPTNDWQGVDFTQGVEYLTGTPLSQQTGRQAMENGRYAEGFAKNQPGIRQTLAGGGAVEGAGSASQAGTAGTVNSIPGRRSGPQFPGDVGGAGNEFRASLPAGWWHDPYGSAGTDIGAVFSNWHNSNTDNDSWRGPGYDDLLNVSNQQRNSRMTGLSELVGAAAQDAQRQLENAYAANRQRDNLIRGGYQEWMDNSLDWQGRSGANLADAFRERQQAGMDLLEGYGQQELRDIENRFAGERANQLQNSINRGLTNTTVEGNMQQGIARREADSLGAAQDRIKRLNLDTYSNLSGDALREQQRSHAERVGLLTEMPKQRLDYLERIEDVYPDLGQLSQLAFQAGQSGYNWNPYGGFLGPYAYGGAGGFGPGQTSPWSHNQQGGGDQGGGGQGGGDQGRGNQDQQVNVTVNQDGQPMVDYQAGYGGSEQPPLPGTPSPGDVMFPWFDYGSGQPRDYGGQQGGSTGSPGGGYGGQTGGSGGNNNITIGGAGQPNLPGTSMPGLPPLPGLGLPPNPGMGYQQGQPSNPQDPFAQAPPLEGPGDWARRQRWEEEKRRQEAKDAAANNKDISGQSQNIIDEAKNMGFNEPDGWEGMSQEERVKKAQEWLKNQPIGMSPFGMPNGLSFAPYTV